MTCAAATGKALSPMVDIRGRRTTSDVSRVSRLSCAAEQNNYSHWCPTLSTFSTLSLDYIFVFCLKIIFTESYSHSSCSWVFVWSTTGDHYVLPIYFICLPLDSYIRDAPTPISEIVVDDCRTLPNGNFYRGRGKNNNLLLAGSNLLSHKPDSQHYFNRIRQVAPTAFVRAFVAHGRSCALCMDQDASWYAHRSLLDEAIFFNIFSACHTNPNPTHWSLAFVMGAQRRA